MPIYLRSDGVNDVAQFASAITIASLGTQAWTFRYKGNITAPAGTTAIAGTSSSSTVAGPAVSTTGQMIIRSSANVTVATSPAGFVIFGEDHKYECDHLAGGAISWKRDDIEVGTGSYTGGASWTNINQFFRATSAATARLQADTEYIEFVGTVNANKWDANLSGGTGNALPTTSGSNAADLINFPTNGDQWVNTGGGAITATVAYDIGEIGFAVSAAASAPGVSASVGYDIGEIVYAASASSSVPVVGASVAYDIGAIEFSVAASAFAPGTIATVSYDIGAVEFSVSASSSVPVFQSEIAYDIGAIEFNIQAAATAAGNFATIAYDIGAIDFNVSAVSSVPFVSATASYDIGEVSFSISAAASAPGSAATVSFDIGEIVFAVSASATGPVPQDISATIGYDIGAISFSVSATVTGIGPGSGIGYGVQFIEPSRGFTFKEPSRGVQF